MFFFIGMHTTKKDCGVEGYHSCTRCGHVGDWHLIRETTWLILLIIPIPIRVRYYSQCPGCHGTAEMSREEFRAAAEGSREQ